MRLFLGLMLTLAAVACGPASPRPVATPPALTPTAAPQPPTPTPTPNYRALAVQLATPLGAMIIALRGNDRAQAAAHFADFNAKADGVLAMIQGDSSQNASLLQSAIISVRHEPGNLAQLEEIRRRLALDVT